MLTFQPIFLVSILLLTNAQWYIKKQYRTKFMNYPNPGKRSLSEEPSFYSDTDCDVPYSQLSSEEDKVAWTLLCGYKKSPSLNNNNNNNENLNDFDVDLTSKSELIRSNKQSSDGILPDLKDYPNTFHNYIKKIVRRLIRNSS